jgi:hypothetical protein
LKDGARNRQSSGRACKLGCARCKSNNMSATVAIQRTLI